ncbi:ATP-binding cassette domain-containing protein [Streptomyces sp. NPDC005811]|uniref:ATP-binding cassette domain-containing protein n=1 Tax=Streptomyces sp. NPDC005811 TaxID=3154565 RepID=UPI0034055B05
MKLTFDSCTYRYRRWKAPIFRDFNYEVSGGLTILLGPNGAGKSTMLKMAASVILPQGGEVSFDGISTARKEYRSTVGWMPQGITPMSTLTAREYVAYIGWLKGMNRRAAWDKAMHALSRVEMAKMADVKSNQLSGGQLRRVGLAASLAHSAKLLLLDEPTAGLDPYQRRVFRNILNEVSGESQILLSTHDVSDLAEEADHVSVMESGRMLYHGETRSFLAHAPAEAPAGRVAEAAYTEVLGASDPFSRKH